MSRELTVTPGELTIQKSLTPSFDFETRKIKIPADASFQDILDILRLMDLRLTYDPRDPDDRVLVWIGEHPHLVDGE